MDNNATKTTEKATQQQSLQCSVNILKKKGTVESYGYLWSEWHNSNVDKKILD